MNKYIKIITGIAALRFVVPAFAESTADSAPEGDPLHGNILTSYLTFQVQTSELPTTPDAIDREASGLLLEKIWKLTEQGKASLDHTSATLGRLGSEHKSESISEVCYTSDWDYDAKNGLSPRSGQTRICGITEEWKPVSADSNGRIKLKFALESVGYEGLHELPSCVGSWKSTERPLFPFFSSDRIAAERFFQSGCWYLVDRNDPVDPNPRPDARSKVSFVRLDVRDHMKAGEADHPAETATFEWIEVDHLMFSRWLASPPSPAVDTDARKQVSSWIGEGRARLISSSQLNLGENEGRIENHEETAYAAFPLVPRVLEGLCNPRDGQKRDAQSFVKTHSGGRTLEWSISSQGTGNRWMVRLIPEWVMRIQSRVPSGTPEPAVADPFDKPTRDPFAEPDNDQNVAEGQPECVCYGTERVNIAFSARPGESLLVGTLVPHDAAGGMDKQKRHLLFLTLHAR